jgi:hypothetical protein
MTLTAKVDHGVIVVAAGNAAAFLVEYSFRIRYRIVGIHSCFLIVFRDSAFCSPVGGVTDLQRLASICSTNTLGYEAARVAEPAGRIGSLQSIQSFRQTNPPSRARPIRFR